MQLSEARDDAIDEAPGAGITLAPLTFRARAFVGAGGVSSDALTEAPGAEYATFERDFMAGRDAADGTGQRRLSAGRMGMGGRC
ncbi:MAG: hypothetical protein ACLVJ8_12315 [Ruthenibacterium lactatiformans]